MNWVTLFLIFALGVSACKSGSSNNESTTVQTSNSGDEPEALSGTLTVNPAEETIIISGSGVFDGSEIDTTQVTSSEPFQLNFSVTVVDNDTVELRIEPEAFSGSLDFTLAVNFLDQFSPPADSYDNVTVTTSGLDGSNASVIDPYFVAGNQIRLTITQSLLVVFERSSSGSQSVTFNANFDQSFGSGSGDGASGTPYTLTSQINESANINLSPANAPSGSTLDCVDLPGHITVNGFVLESDTTGVQEGVYEFNCTVQSGGSSVSSAVYFAQRVKLPRGYNQRPCGFDMDDDGRIGEPEDCNVCDGVTLDPDGDGINEDLIYVDVAGGADDGACGAPGDACASVSQALLNADGNGDGAEDIICVDGTFAIGGSIVPSQSGLATTKNYHGIELPADPFMIVAWDRDNDGEYFPYDADDEFVINDAGGADIVFQWASGNGGHVEIAHVEISGFDDAFQSGIAYWDNNTYSHFYFHDIEAVNMANTRDPANNGFSTFYVGDNQVNHFALHNFACDTCNLIYQDVSDGDPGSSYVRLTNISSQHDAQSNQNMFGAFGFHAMTDVYVEDNIIDLQAASWVGSGSAGVMDVTDCMQRFYVRNNNFLQIERGISIASFYGCTPQARFDEIEISGNIFRRTYGNGIVPFVRVVSETEAGGSLANQPYNLGFEDVRILNNVIKNEHGTAAVGVQLAISNIDQAETGEVIVAGNTFFDQASNEMRSIELIDDGNTHLQQNFTMTHNVFEGFATVDDDYLLAGYEPSSITVDYNVYQGSGEWTVTGATGSPFTTFGAWQTYTGQEANSDQCDPTYVNQGAYDFRPTSGDSCILGVGGTAPSYLQIDLLGVLRSGPTSIGAYDTSN